MLPIVKILHNYAPLSYITLQYHNTQCTYWPNSINTKFNTIYSIQRLIKYNALVCSWMYLVFFKYFLCLSTSTSNILNSKYKYYTWKCVNVYFSPSTSIKHVLGPNPGFHTLHTYFKLQNTHTHTHTQHQTPYIYVSRDMQHNWCPKYYNYLSETQSDYTFWRQLSVCV